jgi:hypothetical protein
MSFETHGGMTETLAAFRSTTKREFGRTFHRTTAVAISFRWWLMSAELVKAKRRVRWQTNRAWRSTSKTGQFSFPVGRTGMFARLDGK